MKIVILDRATIGYDIDLYPIEALGETVIYDNIENEKIEEALRNADVCVMNKKVLCENNLKNCEKLKLICLFATGYNNVDVDYCRKKNIKVRNIPGYCTMSVCQHTFALLFSLIESIGYYDDFVKSGKYTLSGQANHLGRPFFEIDGKVWGIIGMGNIGRSVARAAESFGARVQCAFLSGVDRKEDCERVDIETLFRTSDIISIHSPLNDASKNLINENTLRLMKKTAVIINVGRGGIVESFDLVKAVEEGVIAGAAIDVYPDEPIGENDPFMTTKCPEKFIFTPHIAWGSVEARRRCVEKAAENIKAFIENKGSNDVW